MRFSGRSFALSLIRKKGKVYDNLGRSFRQMTFGFVGNIKKVLVSKKIRMLPL